MRKVSIRTHKAPKPSGFYSQAIQVGDFVFSAGVVGVDPRSGDLVPGGIRVQVRRALENIKAILEEAGTSLDKVIKVNAYLRDIGDFEAYNEVYGEYFDLDEPPARTTVQVGGFRDGRAVEIDVIAYVRKR